MMSPQSPAGFREHVTSQKTPGSDLINDWDTKRVLHWLKGAGFEEYVASFQLYKLTGANLLEMDKKSLCKIGSFTEKSRKHLVGSVAKLKKEEKKKLSGKKGWFRWGKRFLHTSSPADAPCRSTPLREFQITSPVRFNVPVNLLDEQSSEESEEEWSEDETLIENQTPRASTKSRHRRSSTRFSKGAGRASSDDTTKAENAAAMSQQLQRATKDEDNEYMVIEDEEGEIEYQLSKARSLVNRSQQQLKHIQGEDEQQATIPTQEQHEYINSAAEAEHLRAEAEAMQRALDSALINPASQPSSTTRQKSMDASHRAQASASTESLPSRRGDVVYENLPCPETVATSAAVLSTDSANGTSSLATPTKTTLKSMPADIYGTPEGTAYGKPPGLLAGGGPPCDDLYGTPEGNDFSKGVATSSELSPLGKVKQSVNTVKPLFKNPPIFNDVEVDLMYEEYDEQDNNPNKAGLIAAGLYIPPANPLEAHYRKRSKAKSNQRPSQARHRTTTSDKNMKTGLAPPDSDAGHFRSRANTQVEQPEPAFRNRSQTTSGAVTRVDRRHQSSKPEPTHPSQFRPRVRSASGRPFGPGETRARSGIGSTISKFEPFEGTSSLLDRQPWYMGALDRKEAEKCLADAGKNGYCLVRDSLTKPGQLTLSIWLNNVPRHIRIRHQPDGRVCLRSEPNEREIFSSITSMIRYYTKKKLQLSGASPFLLTYAKA